MQDNPNTEDLTPDLLVDQDDWGIAFEPFAGHAYAALRLGFNFAMLRKYFDSQLIKPRPVMEALDLGMEVLFPYTSFHKASLDLFLRLVDGKLTFEEEQMLNALGVKF
jgi:hypothetical protein